MQRGAQDDPPVVLGEIVGVHGVQGWVKVYSWTRPMDNILGFTEWQLLDDAGAARTLKLRSGRQQGKGLIAHLEGVEDRDAARALIGRQIAVPRSALPPAEEGEYYWHDLVGLEVVNREGVVLGRVRRLMETGANDVMVVAGERERLIPFVVDVFVLDVDLGAGRLEVDWDPED
ncbi:Ribosome maturation factor RimM [wastewater metagenome]|uniref:Ribosome maturation factor RimM n=2 Tax=unclassified sequences TaxID=12908 RepID=A0A5B8RDG1_9ZZZZ|nr:MULTISPECIES: ribosome maturation factor RimM [Arhodomonas]MCS4504559.1 ribosome maturation factor RimM [Arhodomonas aquaeolei]QEA05482.1 ribosome maturation factor RimM [uncultured organism]